MIIHATKLLFAAALMVGFAAIPTGSQAESSKMSKSESAGAAQKSQASDDFEENRRAHMQKSKENNQKKGAE